MDPFGGDGRLIEWFLEELSQSRHSGPIVDVSCWDIDPRCTRLAEDRLASLPHRYPFVGSVDIATVDSFEAAMTVPNRFDVCVTNPPWETVKPDRRELSGLSDPDKQRHIDVLKEMSSRLRSRYPRGTADNGYAGWGVSLARCGLEASMKMVREDGLLGIVMPATFFSDTRSHRMRSWVFESSAVQSVRYFEAEAKDFDNVDQQTAVAVIAVDSATSPLIEVASDSWATGVSNETKLSLAQIRRLSYRVPLRTLAGVKTLTKLLTHLPTVSQLETSETDPLWIGRELDETGIAKRLQPDGAVPFAKGRIVQPFKQLQEPYGHLPAGYTSRHQDKWRLVWRDVSRPTQRRRMQATLMPPGWIAGNSLGVAAFQSGSYERILALLTVWNSIVFEHQVRFLSLTGHVSAATVRETHIPDLRDEGTISLLSRIATALLSGDREYGPISEIVVARLSGLTSSEFATLIDDFPKLAADERETLVDSEKWLCAGTLISDHRDR